MLTRRLEGSELRDKPIVIGESDPDGCAACSAAVYPQNGYRNGTLYASYTAASFARKHDLADRHGVNLEGALTWAFEFEDQPYFAGFRDLATNGIDKPVLNVFRMLGRMLGDRVTVESSGGLPLDLVRDTGVRVIVPKDDSPVMKQSKAKGDEVITIEEMKSWLQSKGLTSS